MSFNVNNINLNTILDAKVFNTTTRFSINGVDLGSTYLTVPSFFALGSGTSATVQAIAIDSTGNNVYVGGAFITAGGVTVNRIARWNGSVWSALGSATVGTSGTIQAIAIDSLGNVFVGGQFTTAGGVTVNNIARWNGSIWSALGSATVGTNGIVHTIAIDSTNNVYVGGGFTLAGGVTVNRIARWNGTSWSALAGGFTTASSTVFAIAIDSTNNVYAGGNFTSSGNRIARWNGTSWSALGSGLNNNSVRGIAFDSTGNVYVVGDFSQVEGTLANSIAIWNVSTLSWSRIVSNGNIGVTALAAVYAIGIDSTNNVYIGGIFTTAGGVTVNRIARWNGSVWSSLGGGTVGTIGTSSTVFAIAIDSTNSTNSLYIGGSFITAGGVTVEDITYYSSLPTNYLPLNSYTLNNTPVFIYNRLLTGTLTITTENSTLQYPSSPTYKLIYITEGTGTIRFFDIEAIVLIGGGGGGNVQQTHGTNGPGRGGQVTIVNNPPGGVYTFTVGAGGGVNANGSNSTAVIGGTTYTATGGLANQSTITTSIAGTLIPYNNLYYGGSGGSGGTTSGAGAGNSGGIGGGGGGGGRGSNIGQLGLNDAGSGGRGGGISASLTGGIGGVAPNPGNGAPGGNSFYGGGGGGGGKNSGTASGGTGGSGILNAGSGGGNAGTSAFNLTAGGAGAGGNGGKNTGGGGGKGGIMSANTIAQGGSGGSGIIIVVLQ